MNVYLIPILSAIATAVILPLIVDWMKRRWDYSTNVSKAKFDILTELNTLIWNYHTECARLNGITYPTLIKNLTDEQVKKDLETAKPKYLDAALAVYTGLYNQCC